MCDSNTMRTIAVAATVGVAGAAAYNAAKKDSKFDSSPLPQMAPAPTRQDENPAATAQGKRNKISAMRYGLMSTIRNVEGAAGLGSLVSAGKKTIGG